MIECAYTYLLSIMFTRVERERERKRERERERLREIEREAG